MGHYSLTGHSFVLTIDDGRWYIRPFSRDVMFGKIVVTGPPDYSYYDFFLETNLVSDPEIYAVLWFTNVEDQLCSTLVKFVPAQGLGFRITGMRGTRKVTIKFVPEGTLIDSRQSDLTRLKNREVEFSPDALQEALRVMVSTNHAILDIGGNTDINVSCEVFNHYERQHGVLGRVKMRASGLLDERVLEKIVVEVSYTTSSGVAQRVRQRIGRTDYFKDISLNHPVRIKIVSVR